MPRPADVFAPPRLVVCHTPARQGSFFFHENAVPFLKRILTNQTSPFCHSYFYGKTLRGTEVLRLDRVGVSPAFKKTPGPSHLPDRCIGASRFVKATSDDPVRARI